MAHKNYLKLRFWCLHRKLARTQPLSFVHLLACGCFRIVEWAVVAESILPAKSKMHPLALERQRWSNLEHWNHPYGPGEPRPVSDLE